MIVCTTMKSIAETSIKLVKVDLHFCKAVLPHTHILLPGNRAWMWFVIVLVIDLTLK